MAGAVSGVIRFICHIPLGIAGSAWLGIWSELKHHPELTHPPYSSLIWPAQRIAGCIGIFAFAWNFAMWIPTCVASGLFLYLLGLVDLFIAISLAAAMGMQRTYIPHSKGECSGVVLANPRNSTHPNLYTFTTPSNATIADEVFECKLYINYWAITIAMVVLYFISAVSNIFFGFATAGPYSTSFQRGRERNRGQSIIYYMCCFPVDFVLFLTPTWTIAKIRYGKRVFAKFWRGHAHDKKHGIELVDLKSRAQQPSSFNLLERMLSQQRILSNIASNLHMTDIINLDLTCKPVHETLRGSTWGMPRYSAFREFTCDADKKECAGCENQICTNCQSTRSECWEPALPHTNCVIHCSTCYYSAAISPKPALDTYGDYRLGRCKCPANRERLPGKSGEWTTQSTYSHWNVPLDLRSSSMCRTCAESTNEEIEAATKARWEVNIRRKTKKMTDCGKCRRKLGSGPRWWICTNCNGECKHSAHVAWVKKKEIV